MSEALDRIEADAKTALSRGNQFGHRGRHSDLAPSGGYWQELDPAVVLALVNIAKAAENLISDIDATLDRMENWETIGALRRELAALNKADT